MRDSMHKFTELGQRFPTLRSASERRNDFHEIDGLFSAEELCEQSSRCEQCAVPFCQTYCPVANNIPDWLMLQAEGSTRAAWERLSEVNALPEICGRICPQDRLCEGNCVLERAGHGTVTIGAVEKHISEQAFANGWVRPISPERERGVSIGIVGSGPAGLSAALRLRELGYGVHIYEKQDRAGGLLIYGIPNFKLAKEVVTRRVNWLMDSGVEITLNCCIGKDKSLEDLREKHTAVLLATGVYDARRLGLASEDVSGVISAYGYLQHSDRIYLGDELSARQRSELSARGRRVVVLGGGDTAMDCVRTAQRQGAKSVLCLYRRDRNSMPGSRREVAKAEEEGVVFRFLRNPSSILLDSADDLQGVRVQKMRLAQTGVDGRALSVAIAGEYEDIASDFLIKALGFEAEDLRSDLSLSDLAVTDWGTIVVSKPSMHSSLGGIFAAGDIVRGASLVVWAVREGMDAARGIHDYLQGMEDFSNAASAGTGAREVRRARKVA